MSPLEVLTTVYLLSIPLPFYYALEIKKHGWRCLASEDMLDEASKIAKEKGDDFFFKEPAEVSSNAQISSFIPLINTFSSIAIIGLILIKDRNSEG